MARNPPPLDAMPQEVLEHIAFHTGNSRFLGPPSGLVPLICLNRHMYAQLSLASNVHLYARIFAAKFDTAAAKRRLGPNRIDSSVLALELQRRCFYLKRLRAQVDARYIEANENTLRDLLFHVYLMMLENDGKNELQLREYGNIESWLRIYWFDDRGSSLVCLNILLDRWPTNGTNLSIAMWLLWFFMKLDDLENKASMMHILRVFALSAHQYHLTLYPWTDFLPTRSKSRPSKVTYYSKESYLEPAPLAIPAILSFLTLVNRMAEDSAYPTPLAPSTFPPIINNSLEWECEWSRCINVGQYEGVNFSSDSFKPGSIDGVWEGFFTYTEFTAYAALLAGAPPNILNKSMVVRHRQTWKLREHHLFDDASLPDSSDPLSPGDPLRSYFPIGTKVEEDRNGLHVQEPGKQHTLYYRRTSPVASKHGDVPPNVKDIIVAGEGHSAWGQFNLIGRVRPCDGFVSVSKEYIDSDRGKWLYRGYLVGNVNGNLAGRWRDTLSPAEVPGYEGCFVLSRRR